MLALRKWGGGGGGGGGMLIGGFEMLVLSGLWGLAGG